MIQPLTGDKLIDWLPVGSVLRTYMKYSIVVCSRQEAGHMRLTIPDKCVKFRNPCLNRLEKFDPKPSELAFSAGDVISGGAVD